MKKVLLFTMLAAASLAMQALPTLKNSWTKSQMGILPVADVRNDAPVAISAQGDMYATGIFNEPFSFGKNDLEPIATSAYVLKYTAAGTESWGVSLAGASLITAITTDEVGNVYIAGNIADKVIFGSTDGKTIEKEGLKSPSDGSFYTEKGAGFIAKYDADGVLKAVHSFLPEALPELVATGIYYPMGGDLRFNTNELAFHNGKLYASAIYTGLTKSNGFTLKAGYFDFDGGGFYVGDLPAASVFALNDQMEVSGVVANMCVTGGTSTTSMVVSSVSLAVADGKLYSGFVATGNQTLTIGQQSQEVKLALSGEGVTEYGYIISAINLTTGEAIATKKYSTTHDLIGNYCTLSSMLVKDDALLIGGMFNVALPFDNKQIPASTDDIYAVSLDKTTLNVNWATGSRSDEGEVNKVEEMFTGMAVVDGNLYVIGRIATIKDHVALSPLAYWFNLKSGVMENGRLANYVAGIAALDNKLASLPYKVEDSKLTNFFTMDEVVSSSLSAIGTDVSVSVYPNPVVNDLHFSVPCDVVVFTWVGIPVKQATDVSTLNVSDLAAGSYIVKVTTAAGTHAVKIMKR